MLGLATSSTYNCPDDDPDLCDGRTFAYVYPSDSTQTIYVCEFTFNYPDYAEKVQTVIHELSHFNSIGSTTDNGTSPWVSADTPDVGLCGQLMAKRRAISWLKVTPPLLGGLLIIMDTLQCESSHACM